MCHCWFKLVALAAPIQSEKYSWPNYNQANYFKELAKYTDGVSIDIYVYSSEMLHAHQMPMLQFLKTVLWSNI